MSRQDRDVACRFPIGQIPGGSGNGFVKAILDDCGCVCSPLEAALNIVSGRVGQVDCMHIRQNDKVGLAGASVAWAMSQMPCHYRSSMAFFR
eukprot:scaffold593_cov382-Prasinococcus_capsulatus_cf.AAC.17